jgi:hypothetical protein
MANVNILRDTYGQPVQSLTPGNSVSVSIGGSSGFVALPAGSEVVRLACNAKCFVKFGTSGVVATVTDLMMPVGAEILTVPAGTTHIAAIQDGPVTGVLNVTRMF